MRIRNPFRTNVVSVDQPLLIIKVFVVLSLLCHGSGATRNGDVSVDDFRGPGRTAIPNEGRFRMKSSLLGACATIALLAAAPALAADPAISYVPAQAGI